MKSFLYLAIYSLFLVNFCPESIAQQPVPDSLAVDWKELYPSVLAEYGADQVLLTGISYEDVYPGKAGHPFLFEDKLYKGTLIFREREYNEVNLKYDIFNQQVILYTMQNNSSSWIIPPNDFISAFALGDKWFAKYAFGGEPKFYQVIFDTERLKCLYYWYKSRYDSDQKAEYNSIRFSDSEKKACLLVNDVLMNYSDNKSFIESFPKESQVKIKQYLKNNHIKVAKCSEDRLEAVLTYCKTIM